MTRILNWLGLMRVSEHERSVSDRVSIAVHNDVVNAFKEQHAMKHAKYKKAITDLAAQAEEIAALKKVANYRAEVIEQLQDEIIGLRPDAQRWRDRQRRERERGQRRKGK